MIFRFWQEVSISYIVRVHNLQHSNSIYIHRHKIFYAWHIMMQNLNINIVSTLQLTFHIVWHYECMIFSLNFNKAILCQYSLYYRKFYVSTLSESIVYGTIGDQWNQKWHLMRTKAALLNHNTVCINNHWIASKRTLWSY